MRQFARVLRNEVNSALRWTQQAAMNKVHNTLVKRSGLWGGVGLFWRSPQK